MNTKDHVRRYHAVMDRSSLHTAREILARERSGHARTLDILRNCRYTGVDEDRAMFQGFLDEIDSCLGLVDAALKKSEGEKHVSE